MPCASGKNEKIVIKLSAVRHFHFFCIDIDGMKFGEYHLQVFTFAQDSTYRCRDVGWRERGSRNLIE